jgi:hypothetical protein
MGIRPRRPRVVAEIMPSSWLMVAALLGSSVPGAAQGEIADPCGEAGDELVVDVEASVLFLCRGGQADAQYPVNLGQGGVDKRRQGDKKTPLGRYRLHPPRASVSGFTWFVPVGYPTAEQRRLGYTGGAIGIHGPPDWLPQPVIDLAFATPWTDGCIMVRTTGEIRAIRAWLIEHRPSWIQIVAPSRD